MSYTDSSGTTRFTDDADRENYIKERSKALAASILRADRDKLYSRSAGNKEVIPLEYWLKGDFDTVGLDLNSEDRSATKLQTTDPIKFQVYKASSDLLRNALASQESFNKFAQENNVQNYQNKAWSSFIGNVPTLEGYKTNMIDLNKDKYQTLTGGTPVIAPAADPGHEAAVAALAATKNPINTGPTGIRNTPETTLGTKKNPPASLTPEKWNSMTAQERDLYLRDYNAPNFDQTNPVTSGANNVPGQPVNQPGFRQDLQDMANQDNRPIRDPDTGIVYRPGGNQNTLPNPASNQTVESLVDRALLSNSTVNLNSYDWWNAAPQDIRQAAYQQLQQITSSPQSMADYVLLNGLTNLQNYSWWASSPYKDQAWQIIQSRQNSGQQPGGANTPGIPSTPTNNNAPTVPDVLMSDLFPATTSGDPSTGNEVLDFDKFMQQIGLKDANNQVVDINKKLQDIQTQIMNREKQLATEIGEARDNEWLSASSLDRRVNSAKARAQDDINILLQKQKVYTDQITAINDNIKQSQQAYQTYVDTALKIENSKRENAKIALDQAQAKIDAYYKAQDLQLKQKNYDMLYQNNIRDNSRQAISTLVTALGADAFKVIDPQTFANAGFGALDMTAMAAAISKKDQADLLKNTDSPFAAWLDAYNKGDTARMQAVQTYLQSQKGNNTSLGDYLLGGTALSLPSVADDNTKLKGVKAEGDLILANCVKYQRYLEPSLPYGLTTLQDKINVLLKGPNGSKTPTVGAVGVFDVGTTAGHVAKVVEIKNGMMRLRESNYGGQYARDDRWVPITSALGFWTPSALQSRNDGSFPNIDSKFDEYYAQYKAGTRTKESILNDLTYGVTDKGQVKIIRDYVNAKWGQQEQTFAGLSTDGINKFFQSFGINLNLPNIPAQSQSKYPLNEKPASTTSRKLSNSDIIKLKAAGLWKNEYANMNIWELPEDVLFEIQ